MSSLRPEAPPRRPSIELVVGSASVDTGILGAAGTGGRGGDEGQGGRAGLTRRASESEEEDLETLVSKLNIEKRIEYGAEKFLMALDSPDCSIPLENRPALRQKVGDELEASSGKIQDLQERIDRRSSGTPQKPRRRAQMLNGFASTLSLGSSASPHASPHRSPQPAGGSVQRVPSASTVASSTAGHRRARSRSAGEDVFAERSGSAASQSQTQGYTHGMSWLPGRSERALSVGGASSGVQGGAGPSGDDDSGADDGPVVDVQQAAREVEALCERLNVCADGVRIRSGQEKAAFEGLEGLARVLKRSHRIRYQTDVQRILDATLLFATDLSPTYLRAACYRLYRHLLVDRAAWDVLVRGGIEWLLIRTFVRDNKHAEEKEQAFRLIRLVMLFPAMSLSGPGAEVSLDSPAGEEAPALTDKAAGKRREIPTLSEGLVRCIVSMAENPEDTFRAIALETLAELALADLPCLIDADGFRVLLQALHDGPYELGPSLMSVMLLIMDSPARRQFLPRGVGIDIALAGFSEADGQGGAQLEQLKGCYRNSAVLLKSWPGLMQCCMNDFRGIKSLVDALRIPVLQMREVLLDLFFDVLRIRVPSWFEPLLNVSKVTRRQPVHTRGEGDPASDETGLEDKLSLVDQYVGLLLAIYIDCGLIEALVAVVEENVPGLMKKATLLISEILRLSNRLLPARYAARIQALPRLFELAAAFHNPDERTAALSALSVIDGFNRDRQREHRPGLVDSRHALPLPDSVERGQRQVEQVRIRMGIQVDDRVFQSMLVDSQILYTKDWTKWNFDLIMEIVEGPLLNPKRLEEVFKVSKFGRRLLCFFHPFNRRFADMKRTRSNQKWIRLGTVLITSMLQTPEGIRYLTEDSLLRQLIECFQELDQYSGQPSASPFLSKNRLASTLSVGYFAMLGVLSKSQVGIDILEGLKFFTCCYHLCDLRSRDDLIRLVIEHLDYTIDGHARIVLSKALTSSYMQTRMFATEYLGSLLLTYKFPNWVLELLITQLYDPAMEVCQSAVHFLERACESLETLEIVVNMRPTLEHLGEVGAPLLLRFLSTSVGFSYLRQADYIDREMDEWFNERNLQYVIQIEVILARVFGSLEDEDAGEFFFDGTAPPHFYGEIAKTEAGCKMLQDKGHFRDFAHFLRQHAFEDSDVDILVKLKSVLWAVGNIGSTVGGLPFLEEENIVELIVDIAETSPLLSIRGTGFFALGLISSTIQGSEILEDLEWMATTDSRGEMTGICIPQDITKFAGIDPWKGRPLPDRALPPPLPKLESKILRDISDLGNYVLATQAMRSLARIRSRHRPVFSSVPLYVRAIELISRGHFKQPVRLFIVNMFDISLDTETLAKVCAESLYCETYASAPTARASSGEAVHLPKSATNAMQHHIMAPLSPARAGMADNSVPPDEAGWAGDLGKQTQPAPAAKTIVRGFEIRPTAVRGVA